MSRFYGTSRPKIESDETDQLGIRTIVLAQKWAVASQGENPTIEEVLSSAPQGPVLFGYLPLKPRTTPEGGGFVTRWTYGMEGQSDSNGNGGLKGRGQSNVCRFEPGFSDQTLLRHPDLKKYLSQYGMTVSKGGEIDFAQVIPAAQVAGLGGVQAIGSQINPMYGRKTFLSFQGGTWTYSYAVKKLPANLYANVGKVIKTPPVIKEKFADRDWLTAPPAFNLRGTGEAGDIYQIDEHYLLSEEGGWPREVYKALEGK
jgi:hypothetical protein